mgnify:CR=1 FL=1
MTKKEKNKWLLAGGALLGFFLLSSTRASGSNSAGNVTSLSYLGQSGLPLGMGRNNPGNIVGGVGYQGEILPVNGRFATFKTWAYGIRAMISLLTKYMTSGSSYPNNCVTTPQNTIRLIVTQWAPPASCGGDNPDIAVQKYIAYVASRTGFGPDQKLTPSKSTLRKLVMAMAYFEQGRENVTAAQFDYAFTLV